MCCIDQMKSGCKEHKPTQCDRILKYMDDYGSITPVEALRDLGVMRLASRISQLRSMGWMIEKTMVSANNRYGEKTYFAKYRLKKEDEQNA